MDERADWLAWSLQFFVGFVAGAAFGTLAAWRALIVRAVSPLLVLGVALIGAALASRYGDQLWLGSHRPATDAPKQSLASCRASLVVGCVGGVFVLGDFARSLGLFA